MFMNFWRLRIRTMQRTRILCDCDRPFPIHDLKHHIYSANVSRTLILCCNLDVCFHDLLLTQTLDQNFMWWRSDWWQTALEVICWRVFLSTQNIATNHVTWRSNAWKPLRHTRRTVHQSALHWMVHYSNCTCVSSSIRSCYEYLLCQRSWSACQHFRALWGLLIITSDLINKDVINHWM